MSVFPGYVASDDCRGCRQQSEGARQPQYRIGCGPIEHFDTAFFIRLHFGVTVEQKRVVGQFVQVYSSEKRNGYSN